MRLLVYLSALAAGFALSAETARAQGCQQTGNYAVATPNGQGGR